MKLLFLTFKLLLLSVLSASAATLMLPERQGPPGSLVQIPIVFDDIENLAGLEAILKYDTSVLEFVRLDSLGYSAEMIHADRVRENELAIGIAAPIGLDANTGTLIGLTFRIRTSAAIGSATEITWQKSTLYNEQVELIEHEFEHGVVRVSELACFPNPCTPNGDGWNDVVNFIVPESASANAEVFIYGLSGNIVRTLTSGTTTYLQWDGTDDNGIQAKPGVYLYNVLSQGESIAAGTVTLMR